MTSAERIPLTGLSRELESLTGKPAPPYRALYLLVLDGKLPAVRERRGWEVERPDLPRIAELVRLTTLASAEPPKRRRKTPSTELAVA